MEVAASIVGLLTAGAQISLTLQNLIQGTVNAPSLAQTIHHEITDFRFIITKLQLIVVGTTPLDQSRASLVDIDHFSFTLAGCVCTFSELEQAVSRLSQGGKFDFRSRLKWAMAEETLTALVQRLQNHKLSLTLILTILTSVSSAEALNSKRTLDQQFSPSSTHPTIATVGPTAHTDGPAARVSPIPITPDTPGDPSFYRHDFESTLFNTRPYQRVPMPPGLSPATADRPKATWSLFSGGSNTAVLSMPTSPPSIALAKALKISPPQPPLSRPPHFTEERYDKIGIPPPPGLPKTGGISSMVAIDLHTAAQNGNDEIVVRLLQQGADREARDTDGQTPLHVASWHGREATVLLLLDQGATLDVKDVHGQAPLHLAALGGHDNVVAMLLGRGADREAKDVHGQVPLHHAALGGKDSTVQLLLRREVGAEANITRRRKKVQNVGRRVKSQTSAEREPRYSEVCGGRDLDRRYGVRYGVMRRCTPLAPQSFNAVSQLVCQIQSEEFVD